MEVSDIELMKIQAETLFVTDDDGRLVGINEPYEGDGGAAPIVFVGSTRLGTIIRFNRDVPEEVCLEVEELIDGKSVTGPPRRAPEYLDGLMRTLEPYSSSRQYWMGPAYRFPESVQAPKRAVEVTGVNSHVLEAEFAELIPDLARIGSIAAVVEDGCAVSICHSSRRSTKAEEAGVYTIPSHLGRGFATDAVACWAQIVRNAGRIPIYSTSWDNLASQRIAEKLGLLMFGVDLSIN